MPRKRYRSSRQVEGVIDLERLMSGQPNCIERDPDRFFDLTYPSEDLRGVLHALGRRFSSSENKGAGFFLAEAIRGFGMLHARLMEFGASTFPRRREG
jgi:hypothetical protein